MRIVESLLVVTMAAFHFPVVPGRLWPDRLVMDMQPHAQQVQWMYALRFGRMRKLRPVICLYRRRRIAEVNDGALHKVHGRIAAFLFVCAEEMFSGCLVDHGVLVELLSVRTDVAGRRNILQIHLPLDTRLLRRVIMAVVPGFFCGFNLLAVT